MGEFLKQQHTFCDTRTKHVQVSKQFAANLLDFVLENAIQYGKKFILVDGGNKVYSSKEIVELYEESR